MCSCPAPHSNPAAQNSAPADVQADMVDGIAQENIDRMQQKAAAGMKKGKITPEFLRTAAAAAAARAPGEVHAWQPHPSMHPTAPLQLLNCPARTSKY